MSSDDYVVHPADRPFGAPTVTCRCTRTMDAVYQVGRNNFRCGCGNEVTVSLAADYRTDPNLCQLIVEGARCGRPVYRGVQTSPIVSAGLGLVCDECAISMLHGWAEDPEVREYFIKLTMRGELSYRRRKAVQEWYDRDREIEPARSVRPGHVVYYVRLGKDHIKIGTTGDLNRRMRELRVANPSNLLAVERGTVVLEKHRHKQFAAYKFAGWREDFHESEELLMHIEIVNEITRKDLDEAA
jgi:hypothetical protein